MEYKTEFFDRSRIETVFHTQHNFRDKLFAKWDIVIKLDHGIEFPFENISYPQKQANKIIKYKENFSKANPNKNNPQQYNENISILAEALWEVVKEYMDKKTETPEEDGTDFNY